VCYYNLAKRLGPNQPLTALQLFDPSMARKNLPQTLEEIAAEYLPLIRSFQPVGPYQLIGWCVGGVLAFEVARQLVAAGEEVSLLTLIDAWAPGHSKRISRTRAMLADYSYRWQLIAADWRRVMSRKKSLAMFLTQRTLYKKLRRLFGHTLDEPTPVTFATRELSAENYDQWLLGYLEETAQAYEPKMYPGKITLLCSTQEPKGLFLDRRMGWSAFALKGVDVAIIDGDHFTVFNGRGLEQMATHVSTVIKFDSNRRMRQTASA
jgi:thioesterase domain-containing protein